MRPEHTHRVMDYDLVVVGSGAAGLSATLAAAEAGARVALLTAGPLLSGSSPCAQGGIAAALDADDTPHLHGEDTLAVGAGLNDAEAVGALVVDGRRRVRALLAAGVPFEGGAAHPDLGLEAGHSRRRIVHAGGGATGRIVTRALLARAVEHPCVRLFPRTPAEELILDGPRVVGVRSGATVHRGRGVVLATGGYAALWDRATNPPENRGAGLALAWQAGASLADLEFVQFHPTALALPGRPAFLLSEALRGEGALIVDADERPILDPLQPRDVVARGIARHLRDRGPVYLSLRQRDPDEVHRLFPAIAGPLRAWGLDLARALLPIAPAAHYCMGGIRVDVDGRTDVPGLYAAGEAACTGAQGANRLASNSLLECLVFGRRAATSALHDASPRHATWPTASLPESVSLCNDRNHTGREVPSAPSSWLRGSVVRSKELSSRLDRDLGVERDGTTLAALVRDLPIPADDEDASDSGHLVAALAARAALLRRESRGAHFRRDVPATAPHWRGRIHWRRGMAPQFERIVP